jgi:hypothetical protein
MKKLMIGWADDDVCDEIWFDFPTKPRFAAICSECRGTTTVLCDHLRGVDVTDSVHEDPDFAEEYFGGRYDRTCSRCNGSGAVIVTDEIDYELAEKQHPREYAMICELWQDRANHAEEAAAERRAGC